ncbi:hypothetical protein BD310DRAFT_329214 [Dichomitus squalens]|uniref:Uncharacterized protein n=1 Tax=Dichomitus squalens TaxID=114155 RepID=A0A4Q9Q1D5_9APHY|nr:hypothetical protein BD310DRAFT_329214 [Dichomitus squalens]
MHLMTWYPDQISPTACKLSPVAPSSFARYARLCFESLPVRRRYKNGRKDQFARAWERDHSSELNAVSEGPPRKRLHKFLRFSTNECCNCYVLLLWSLLRVLSWLCSNCVVTPRVVYHATMLYNTDRDSVCCSWSPLSRPAMILRSPYTTSLNCASERSSHLLLV